MLQFLRPPLYSLPFRHLGALHRDHLAADRSDSRGEFTRINLVKAGAPVELRPAKKFRRDDVGARNKEHSVGAVSIAEPRGSRTVR